MDDKKSIPIKARPRFEQVVAIIEKVCHEHLNDEYADLSRKLAAALARKRPSPLDRGKPEIWACGIVHAIGFVNFLSDPSHSPHLKPNELYAAFGVSVASTSAKSKLIRNLFDIHRFSPEWTLPSLLDKNPMIWFLSVNGLMVDIRSMPREVQEIAYLKGLIPYIPADHPECNSRHQQ